MFASTTRTIALFMLLLIVPIDGALAATLHVLIVADDEQGIVQHTNVSTIYITQAIEANIPANQVVTREIDTDDFKTSNILAAIEGLSPAHGDSVMLYYVGHGAVTDQGKPYMVSGARDGEPDLTVATAMQRLSGCGAHAIIAVFDMCSVCPNCNVAGFVGGEPANGVSPLFDSLFFRPGIAGSKSCIISSSRGQPALTLAPVSPTDRYDGGMYTWCFAKHLVDRSAQPSNFNALHAAVRKDVAKASTWHPLRNRLTNKYDRKQVPVQYNAWK